MMRKIVFFLLINLTGLLSFGQTYQAGYQDGKLWVRLKENIDPKTGGELKPNYVADNQSLPFANQLSEKYQITKVTRAFRDNASDKLNRTLELSFGNYALADKLIEELIGDAKVELAEKIPYNTKCLDPNDPSLSNQWHLAKINAPIAWNYFSVGSTTVIAVVDDAVDIFHPDLNPNIWVNPGEIAGNGIDDDGNGYVDDVNGFDLGSNDNDPNPPTLSYDHGTHVAGIASAATNNSIGISSIGFSCKIMCVKASGSDPNSITQGYGGIIYAANNGAKVINMSWGSTSFSSTAQSTIEYCLSKGSILVAAAGNNNNDALHYPSAYAGVVSVASTDINDVRSGFSSYGTTVKVSAPGTAIYSTVPYGNYGTKQGTSMASPLVAGLVGLMRSLNPGMPNDDLLNCLYSTADPIIIQNPTFPGLLGSGRINAAAAMACVANSLNTAPIADFTGTPRTLIQGGSVTYTENSLYNPTSWQWTFPGGTPSSFNGKTPPAIVYNTPGTYNVTLTASNAFGNNAKTRTNYIVVNPTPSCNTIDYPLPPGWTPISYASGVNNANGFANGFNSILDKQKAMFFDMSATTNIGLTGFHVIFARANSADLNKKIKFHVYDGTSGTPGAELGVYEKTMGQIRQNVQAIQLTNISLPKNIILPASKKFFISVDMTALEWNSTVKDSLSIYSNLGGQTPSGTPIWDQKADGTWKNYGTAGTWPFTNLSLFIHPILTSSPALSVISPSSADVCQGTAVEFDATGSSYKNLLQWEFPGANAPTIVNNQLKVIPQYTTPGTYKVYLSTNGGCDEVRKDSVSIIIRSSPNLSISANKNPICVGETATLTATGATSYSWSPATGLNTTAGSVVLANPTTTVTYTLTGIQGSCFGTIPYELEVRSSSADVSLTASQINITVPTSVTFTATGSNGGGNPTFAFKVNNLTLQNGPSNSFTSTVVPNDLVVCDMTTTEICVVEKTVSSNVIKMGETTVPVILGVFTGKKVGAGHLIEWTTVTEANSNRFEVERSSDAQNFTKIGTVNAGFYSNTSLQYNLTDANPMPGRNFYRLKMVDKDGSSTFSNIILLNAGKQEWFSSLYPNPATGGQSAILNVSGIDKGKIGISISNTNGQVIRSSQMTSTNGALQLTIPTSNLASGMYFITLRDETGKVQQTIRWMVVR